MPSPARVLPASFFARPTLVVARELLGAVLVHETADGRAAGRIVEVEAYIGESDPGCHAAAGPTPRNAPLYGQPGVAYVYLNYGMHCLVNAVTEGEGRPAALLIRALAPTEGVPLMRWRRGATASAVVDDALCRGPGRLARALGITLAQNRLVLGASPLAIEAGVAVRRVAWTRRIGLTRGGDRYWRCVVPGHPSLSGTRAWNADARPRPWPARAVADAG
ncbi:MAG: DNA-3-methyladenine glycosylase [Vicinamibacterales bacterium]